MNIEIKHLQLISNIYDLGSLSQAAEKMYISQPAASHMLKNFEERLGGAVFKRVNKKLVLTQVGEVLLHAANEVLPKIAHYEIQLDELIKGKTGRIRIATECHTSYSWLPKVLLSFKEQHPDIEIDIEVEATSNPLQYLDEGKIDMAIMIDTAFENHYSYHPLFEDEMMLVTSKDHKLALKKYVEAKDFKNENYIMYAEEFESNSVANKVLIPAMVRPEKITKLKLTEAIIEMAKANIGIASLSNWLIKPYLTSRTLKVTKITKTGLFRQWSVVSHHEKPKHLIDFIAHLQQNIIR